MKKLNELELRKKIDFKMNLHGLMSYGKYYHRFLDDSTYRNSFHMYEPSRDKLRGIYEEYLKDILRDCKLMDNVLEYLNLRLPYFKTKSKKSTDYFYTYFTMDEVIKVIKKYKNKEIDLNLMFIK